jgi:hypothetical protein
MKRFLPIILGFVFLMGALGACDRIQQDVAPNPSVDVSGQLLSNRTFYSDPNSYIALDIKDFLRETKGNSLTIEKNGDLGKASLLAAQNLLVYYADSSVNSAEDFVVLKTINAETGKKRLDTVNIKINSDITSFPCNAGAIPDFFKIDNTVLTSQSFVLDVLKNDRYCNAILDSTSLQVVVRPSKGIAVVKNNRIVYTPPVGFDGSEVFLYKICTTSEKPICRIVSVRLDIEGSTQRPCVTTLASDIWAIALSDTTVQYIDVLKNDKLCDDIDRSSLKISIKPKYGTAIVNSNNIIEYRFVPSLLPVNTKVREDILAYTVNKKSGILSPNVPVTIIFKDLSSCKANVEDGMMDVKEASLLAGASIEIPYYLNMTSCTHIASVSVISQGKYGTVSVLNGQQLIYKLNSNLKDKGKNREDNFSYLLKTKEGQQFSVNFKVRITS